MKRNYIITILQTLVVLMCMTVICESCSSSETVEEPVVIPEVPEVVKNPVKVVQYDRSTQFKNDIDAVCQLAFVLRAMTWNYWMMASDGLKQPEDFFTVDLMDAYTHLGNIIGEETDEDLFDRIFSEFCMGK